MTKWQKGFIRGLLQAGACATAIVAILGAWHLLSLPTPAWSSDIHKLNSNQAAIAAELYNQKLRGYLASQPPTDPTAKQIFDEELRQARQQRDEAEKRRIDLAK